MNPATPVLRGVECKSGASGSSRAGSGRAWAQRVPCRQLRSAEFCVIGTGCARPRRPSCCGWGRPL